VPLAIGTISPASAPAAGGTTITIRGSNFQTGTTATIAGKNAANTPTQTRQPLQLPP
jgi:hypothetical protein